MFPPESVTLSTGKVSSVAGHHDPALGRAVRDPAGQNLLEPEYFHLADSEVIVSTPEILHHQAVSLQTWPEMTIILNTDDLRTHQNSP